MSPLEYGAESLRDNCGRIVPCSVSLICVPSCLCAPRLPWTGLVGAGKAECYLGFPRLCRAAFPPNPARGSCSRRSGRSGLGRAKDTDRRTLPALPDRHPPDTGTHIPSVSSSFLPWHLPLPRRCPARRVPCPAAAAAPHLAQRWARLACGETSIGSGLCLPAFAPPVPRSTSALSPPLPGRLSLPLFQELFSQNSSATENRAIFLFC